MVHRKSEYRLSYRWLPQHLCQVTRESLADYRVRRRRTDLDHQSWAWDPAAACECDRDDGAEVEEGDRHLPVPENRAKHNALLEQWRMDRFRPSPVPLPRQALSRYDYGRAGALPVRDGEAGQRLDRPEIDGGHLADEEAGNYRGRLSLREHPAGMPSRDEDDLERQYPHGECWADRVALPVPAVVSSYREPAPPTDDIGSSRAYRHKALTQRVAVGPREHFQPTIGGYRSRTHRSLSAEPRRRKMDIAPTEPAERCVAVASKNGVAPTVKFRGDNTTAAPLPPHEFTNKANGVGKTLARNVQQSQQQVSPVATRALKFKEPSNFPREHYVNNLTRSKRWPTHAAAPVNHSSLWMTEYSRNFTRAMRG